MYIEDILTDLFSFHYGKLQRSPPTFFSHTDKSYLESFRGQILINQGLTEKQANLILRIFGRYQAAISNHIGVDITQDINNPQWRLGIRKNLDSKQVKIIDLGKNFKKIAVSFPYDDQLVQEFKKLRHEMIPTMSIPHIRSLSWNQNERTWDFYLYEPYINWLINSLLPKNFIFDQEILDWAKEIEEIEKVAETYVPMVVFEDEKFIYKNVSHKIPQPDTDDFLEVLFMAKKYGIITWDESIQLALADTSFNKLTRSFLNFQDSISTSEGVQIDSNIIDFLDLSDIIKYNGTTLIVIPGGSELVNLKKSHSKLKEMGYTDDQMSALFRTDGETSKETNDYIKENNLNNSISEKIKIFFVSQRYPKPMIKNNVKIGTIINLGDANVHHTMRTFIKNHHNVLNYKFKKE